MADMMDQIDVLMSRVTDTYTNKAIECGLEDLDIRKMESDINKLSIEADRLMQAGNVIRVSIIGADKDTPVKYVTVK